MLVHCLTFRGFRNLESGETRPAAGVNVIRGDNAQGKTNLIEALWLFTGGRSFRGSKDREMIRFGEASAELSLSFTAQEREQEAQIKIAPRRTVTLCGIDQPSPSALAGVFRAVVFSPAHLSLAKDGPEGRRRFIDAAYCQLRPGYIRILGEYHRALTQRNALLRKIREMRTPLPETTAQLDVWDEGLAKAGAQVYAARTAYVKKLTVPAGEIYSGIAGGRESLSLRYDSFAQEGASPAEAAAEMLLRLEESRNSDIRAGFTSVGPHRDNLFIAVNGIDARLYASQGQQRSSVLALKLAEASVLMSVTGERPVALLDDVMSELDAGRQDYILNHIDGWQVFLTCCDPFDEKRFSGSGHSKIFTVRAGTLREY